MMTPICNHGMENWRPGIWSWKPATRLKDRMAPRATPIAHSQQGYEGGFYQEAQLNHTLSVAYGTQHSDVLTPFHHRPQTDDAQGCDANYQAHAHEAD